MSPPQTCTSLTMPPRAQFKAPALPRGRLGLQAPPTRYLHIYKQPFSSMDALTSPPQRVRACALENGGFGTPSQPCTLLVQCSAMFVLNAR